MQSLHQPCSGALSYWRNISVLETLEQPDFCTSIAEGAIWSKWNGIIHVRIEHQWKDIQYSLRVLPDNQSNISPSCSGGDHVPRSTPRDCKQGHKSQSRTLQLLLVSACCEDTEIFAIATFEKLALDVFVLLFCLHLGFANMSLVINRLPSYKLLGVLKVTHCSIY